VPAGGDAAFEEEMREVFRSLHIEGGAELDETTAAVCPRSGPRPPLSRQKDPWRKTPLHQRGTTRSTSRASRQPRCGHPTSQS